LKNNQWYCSEHGAKFDLSGQGLNDKGRNHLKIYNTNLTGSQLRIFG